MWWVVNYLLLYIAKALFFDCVLLLKSSYQASVGYSAAVLTTNNLVQHYDCPPHTLHHPTQPQTEELHNWNGLPQLSGSTCDMLMALAPCGLSLCSGVCIAFSDCISHRVCALGVLCGLSQTTLLASKRITITRDLEKVFLSNYQSGRVYKSTRAVRVP